MQPTSEPKLRHKHSRDIPTHLRGPVPFSDDGSCGFCCGCLYAAIWTSHASAHLASVRLRREERREGLRLSRPPPRRSSLRSFSCPSHDRT